MILRRRILNKKEFGKIGESVACKYLKKKNYEIIDTNFFFRGGEIDIIAFDTEKNELVFFEIKSRDVRRRKTKNRSCDPTVPCAVFLWSPHDYKP